MNNTKMPKDELLTLLILSQNKLKNSIVMNELKKYIDDENLFRTLKTIINLYIDSIDSIYGTKDFNELKLLAENLKTFITNTEDNTRIYLYHIKILDSINLIIDSASKYEKKGYEDKNDYFIDSMSQKNNILQLGKFRVKQEKIELFKNTFEDYGTELHNITFDFISGNDKGNEIEFVIKFQNEKTGFKDSITKLISRDKLQWFDDFFEKIDERVYYEIVEEYLYKLNYPKNSIKIEYKLFNTNNRTDVSILHNDKIIAIIEVKRDNKRQYPNIDRVHTEQLNKYYYTTVSNQNIIPKMFLVFFYDSLYTFYEYEIESNKIQKLEQLPNYNSVVDSIVIVNNNTETTSHRWDDFIKTINVDKLVKIIKGVKDNNLEEGLRIRDFLNNLKDEIISELPILSSYKAEQNQAPTQQYWTPDNGFRLSFYKGEYSVKETQINITLWASWGGAVFIKDNKKILTNDKILQKKICDKYNVTYEDNLHIMLLHFKDGFPKFTQVIEALKVLIDIYNEIESNSDENNIKIATSKLTYTSFDNDQINSKKDYIDISKDIDAFAKLIAYKDLQPPLSIALFGKWGSGKSTFMDIMENRIEELSDLKVKTFCKSVCHIKFNAWHYSDTNLWASLVSHIFKELDKYINKDKTKDKISIYTELLDSQKKELEDKEAQQLKIEAEIEEYKNNIEKIENEKTSILKEISQLDLADIKKEIFDDKDIQKELEKIKTDVNIKYGKELIDIQDTYYELKTTFGTYKKAIELFYSDNGSRKYLYFSIIVLIIVLLGSSYINEVWSYVGSFIATIVAGKLSLKKYLKDVEPITKTLEKFIKNYEDKEDEIKRQKEDKKIEIQKEIDKKNLEIKEKESFIQRDKNKIDDIKKEIEKIKSGEYLANFIADRSNSDDYKKHLGLVSVIREDFDNLKKHLAELEQDPKYNIERIVLYIDDLDRCPNNKVIQVLEAIHLLLAFDLFVVIVGVDSRWVTSSLVKERGLSIENDDKATPYDYLEKIFQIPFKVKPLTEINKKTLIDSLLQNDKEENQKKDNLYVESSYVEDGYIDSINDKEKKEEITQKFTEENHVQEDENELEYDEYTKMTFTKEEIEYMEILSSCIGDTPRTIKRFINIYRIVKNHDEIKTTMENYKDDYRLVLVILCIVFNNPEYLIDEQSPKEDKVLSDEFMEIYKNADKVRKKQYIDFLLRFSFKD